MAMKLKKKLIFFFILFQNDKNLGISLKNCFLQPISVHFPTKIQDLSTIDYNDSVCKSVMKCDFTDLQVQFAVSLYKQLVS